MQPSTKGPLTDRPALQDTGITSLPHSQRSASTDATIKDALILYVHSLPRGTIFFTDDANTSVPHSKVFLPDLCKDGTIVKLCRGVYVLPRQNDYGKYILPTVEEIVTAVGTKYRAEILPTGEKAAYELGLCGQVTRPLEWYTSGSNMTIKLDGGKEIRLVRKLNEKLFCFDSRTMLLLRLAVPFIGKDRIEEWHEKVIRLHLDKVGEKEFVHDLELCQEWVRELLKVLR